MEIEKKRNEQEKETLRDLKRREERNVALEIEVKKKKRKKKKKKA